MIETNIMSIEVDLTNGQTLVLSAGNSKKISIAYSTDKSKHKFMAYTEENRLWCIAERRRLNRMMIVKDARIVHKNVKS